MKRELITHHSEYLNRDMNILVHGEAGGVPMIAFPCQDGMCDNWESFQMQDTIGDYIENGEIQLFSVDTVDKESWSDKNGDKEHRAWIQEQYYNYIIEEALPLIRSLNGTDNLPIAAGFSLGATHAAIVAFRRPDLFGGMMGCSGCYDAPHFWDDWCNSTLYDNSPVHFLANMPEDHPWVKLYNDRKFVICVGQGRWEVEGLRTAGILKNIFKEKNIDVWVDHWGFDVDHDWPWWRVQIRYFLPWLLGKEERNTNN